MWDTTKEVVEFTNNLFSLALATTALWALIFKRKNISAFIRSLNRIEASFAFRQLTPILNRLKKKINATYPDAAAIKHEIPAIVACLGAQRDQQSVKPILDSLRQLQTEGDTQKLAAEMNGIVNSISLLEIRFVGEGVNE